VISNPHINNCVLTTEDPDPSSQPQPDLAVLITPTPAGNPILLHFSLPASIVFSHPRACCSARRRRRTGAVRLSLRHARLSKTLALPLRPPIQSSMAAPQPVGSAPAPEAPPSAQVVSSLGRASQCVPPRLSSRADLLVSPRAGGQRVRAAVLPRPAPVAGSGLPLLPGRQPPRPPRPRRCQR
jgi:hypothetical protein